MKEEELISITPTWHIQVWRRYKASWFDEHFRFSAPIAIVVFFLSVLTNYAGGVYATERASNYVSDIILSNTPVFNVGYLFVYGASVLIVIILFLVLHHPKRIPFLLHSLSLFYFIRAAFVSMTHLGPFPLQAQLNAGELALRFFGGNDLFFSGHTGVPFLMALMFWHIPRLRYFFLAASVFFGVVVLLGHLHYTIDVFSAFFITFGIYHLALWLFPKERALFLSEE